MADWIVLLEAVRDRYSAEIDKETLSRLLQAVGHARPVGLHSRDRYAVQFHVPAAGPLEAVSSALSEWSAALRTMGIAPWELVRAEAMTEAELADELALAGDADVPASEPDEVLGAGLTSGSAS